jgi:hypothetical protein
MKRFWEFDLGCIIIEFSLYNHKEWFYVCSGSFYHEDNRVFGLSKDIWFLTRFHIQYSAMI